MSLDHLVYELERIVNRSERGFSYYLYQVEQTTTLAQPAKVGDASIEVSDATSIEVDDMITLFDNNSIYQSVVNSVSGTTIGVGSPVDTKFIKSGTEVEAGTRDLSVDGSSTPVIFEFPCPKKTYTYLSSMTINILDDVSMTGLEFGSITDGLDNGLLIRIKDTDIYNNICLVRNNLEFAEQGFDITYDEKVTNVYTLRAKKNFKEELGTSTRLLGENSERFQVFVQDDLTSQSKIRASVHGYVLRRELYKKVREID